MANLTSMNIDQLKAHIEILNMSLTNVERQLGDQTHASRVFCGGSNVRGLLSGKEADEQQRFCLQRRKEELLKEIKKAKDCLINKQSHGKRSL